MDEQQSPEKRNEKNNDRDSSNTEFSFKYTEVGGISTNHYLIISYNSKKNIITSSKDVSGSNAMQKQPSESDEQELKEIGRANEFFRTKSDYSPEKEDENLMAHTLTITVGGNIHTTTWTDASKDIPESIINIVNRIKKIVSKEKIV